VDGEREEKMEGLGLESSGVLVVALMMEKGCDIQ